MDYNPSRKEREAYKFGYNSAQYELLGTGYIPKNPFDNISDMKLWEAWEIGYNDGFEDEVIHLNLIKEQIMDYQTIAVIAVLSAAVLSVVALGVLYVMFIINDLSLMIDFPVKVRYNKYIAWLMKHKEQIVRLGGSTRRLHHKRKHPARRLLQGRVTGNRTATNTCFTCVYDGGDIGSIAMIKVCGD